LATSNYLAAGGSGFRVLQRNTTQLDTKIEMRDALVDYVRAGKPCGYSASYGTAEGLKPCASDADCSGIEGGFTCACPETAQEDPSTGACSSSGNCGSTGRCVRRSCRDDVARHHRDICKSSYSSALRETCEQNLGACQLAGETCKFLACIDNSIGNFTDDRLMMLGR
jgi:5'-nucleotidase